MAADSTARCIASQSDHGVYFPHVWPCPCPHAISTRRPEHDAPFGAVRPGQPQEPQLREVAVTACVFFPSRCRFFPCLRPCGLWASMNYPVSPGHRCVSSRHTDGVTSSRFVATVFYWRLAVSLDAQYYTVVHTLELRASLSCVYRELTVAVRLHSVHLCRTPRALYGRILDGFAPLRRRANASADRGSPF